MNGVDWDDCLQVECWVSLEDDSLLAAVTHVQASAFPLRKARPEICCLSTQVLISSTSGAGRICPHPSGPPFFSVCAR